MRTVLFTSAALAVVCFNAPAAFAQDAPVALDEVVITAQRRSENLQKTPLTVSAVTGDKLESQGVKTVVDLASQVPALQITSSGSGAAQVFLRGIGSTNTTEVGDPAVAYHIDGIYQARSTSVGALFYDIDRVEVLRGPQGTLYGRNATAGAINVITKKPVLGEYEGAGSIEVGNYSAVTTSGLINVPIGDTLAVRASFQQSRHDGYVNAINQGPGTGGNDRYDQDDKSARVRVLWKPSDNFSLILNADYLHQGGAGGGDGTYGTTRVTGDPWTCNCSTNLYRNNRFFSTGAEASWDLGFANLTYLVGYNFSKLDRTGENASTGAPNYFLGKDYTWSHELRLGGDAGKLKWVVGLYRFTEDNNVDFRVFLANNSYLSFIQPEITAESIAVFGQTTYEVTDRFRVTGGLRYTEDKKGRVGGTYLTNSAGAIVSTVVANVADAKWDATNWKLGADFDLTSTSMLYANVATGYKAGGYYDGIADNVYAPEKITSYEAGVKNRFLDNRLQVNATAFLYDYRDFQVSALGTIGGQDATVTLNADKAKIYGLEFETNLALTEHDRIDATLGWLHAEYTDFVLPRGDSFSNNNANATVAACYTANYAAAAPRSTDFSGCRMARTPEWTFNLGYQHIWELSFGGALTGRIQTHYETSKNLEYHGFAENKEGAFTKTDVSLTYASPDDRWTLQGYVRNLEDDDVRTASAPNSTTGLATNGAGEFYAPPRTYGLRLGVTF
ncbi:TonB-dependent receptor [Caulobacter endophyticus]|uniref:TonB-dependent receptor n=1 Tax=Caulobacter endophyticus TaxID=2172652 RepID=UPI0024106C0E|nr:TonB-dependent receptor [Caulobacter endophyticus]MDG2529022.1 TonB-dependent receptor [Caulobacter endophyticus]